MATRFGTTNSEDDSEQDDAPYSDESTASESSDSLNSEESLIQSLDVDTGVVMEESTVSDLNEWTTIVGKAANTEFMNSEKMLITIKGSSISKAVMPIDVYHAIVSEEIMDLIVIETNNYAKERNSKFRETNIAEMRKFLGLVCYMGNVHLPMISLYWSIDPIYNLPLPRKVMPRDRFLSLLRNFHASDNHSMEFGRLSKIQPLLDRLNKNFQHVYEPGERLVVDESMVPWRSRLVFRQYMPGKKKNGIKLFKLCPPDGYTSNIIIYPGKQSSPQIDTEFDVGISGKYVISLAHSYLNQGRTIYMDNWYTSISLTENFYTIIPRAQVLLGKIVGVCQMK